MIISSGKEFGLRSGWLRLWRTGPGISWTKEPPLFSERIGLRRPFMVIRGWRFKWLGRVK